MVGAVPDILARIVARKQLELREKPLTEAQLHRTAELRRGERRPFLASLRARKTAIIAEIKQASPSKGILQTDFRPGPQAQAYEDGGAAALSVLTDRDFFQGSLRDLETARENCRLPVLRKDFTVDRYHVVEAAAHGADAILLIAAILDTAQLRDFRELAAELDMDALVEVHSAAELDRALGSGAHWIGVNNRDLHTFQVDLRTSLDLAPRMPADVFRVSESGIENAQQIAQLRAAGYGAFLIGESLMRSGDPRAALRSLLS